MSTNPSTEHAPSTVAAAAAAAAGPTGETFVQPKITGYRQLSEDDAALMNRIKAHGAELERLCAEVYVRGANQLGVARELKHEAEVQRLYAAEPGRWVELARVDLQRGLMALTRAVAQPSSF